MDHMTQPTREQAQHDHPAGAELSWDAADFGPEHYATPEEVEAMTQDVTEE
jgi:hypothetical protein